MKKIVLFILLFFMLGCAVSKDDMFATGGTHEMIHNAIVDYSQTEKKLFKHHNVFYVWADTINNNTIIHIGKDYDPMTIMIDEHGKLKYHIVFTGLEEYKNKLYYWKDKREITDSIVRIYEKYNYVDTIPYWEGESVTIDCAQRIVSYMFDNHNILRYKKLP